MSSGKEAKDKTRKDVEVRLVRNGEKRMWEVTDEVVSRQGKFRRQRAPSTAGRRGEAVRKSGGPAVPKCTPQEKNTNLSQPESANQRGKDGIQAVDSGHSGGGVPAGADKVRRSIAD